MDLQIRSRRALVTAGRPALRVDGGVVRSIG